MVNYDIAGAFDKRWWIMVLGAHLKQDGAHKGGGVHTRCRHLALEELGPFQPSLSRRHFLPLRIGMTFDAHSRGGAAMNMMSTHI